MGGGVACYADAGVLRESLLTDRKLPPSVLLASYCWVVVLAVIVFLIIRLALMTIDGDYKILMMTND